MKLKILIIYSKVVKRFTIITPTPISPTSTFYYNIDNAVGNEHNHPHLSLGDEKRQRGRAC